MEPFCKRDEEKAAMEVNLYSILPFQDTVRGTHDHPPVPERTVKAVLFRETVSRMVKDRPDLRPMQIIADLKILHQSTWTYLKLKVE